MFRMLSRITLSSDAHRTESVTAMDHEQTMDCGSVTAAFSNMFDKSDFLVVKLLTITEDCSIIVLDIPAVIRVTIIKLQAETLLINE